MTKNVHKIFFLFLLVHLLVWTLVPYLSNKNLPLDTIEALAWASNLDWGFNKHPPLSAFSVEIIYQIFGNRDWAYYLLSQIYICFAFFIIWYFSKDFFKNQIYSLISILLLEGIYFYNYTTPEFNVYICEIPFWSLTVLFCWRGFKNNKSTDWLLFGFFAGLGVLSHYLFLYLLIAIDVFFIYMLISKKINFKCLISLITFFLILSPHLIWLTENEYVTFTYGLHRTGLEEQNFLSHITHPLVFLGKQVGILLPFFVMFLIVISKFKAKLNFKDEKLLFLLSINIVPITLIFLTSMLFGIKIRTMWMTPFYLFLGVLFVYLFQKSISLKKINQFISIFLILFFISPAAYSYISISKTNKRTDYPGKEIARLVQNRWNKNFSNKIKIVIGDEWFGGNLSYHLSSRPKLFNETPNFKTDKRIDIEDSVGGVVYVGNPKVLKEVCRGVFGTIKPIGICMIGSK
tara:strand:- start:1326 stop:2705 length:1380 start_codon:yes stop_codon:yes gene_type:complete